MLWEVCRNKPCGKENEPPLCRDRRGSTWPCQTKVCITMYTGCINNYTWFQSTIIIICFNMLEHRYMHAIHKCVSTILSVQDVQLSKEVFSICHVRCQSPRTMSMQRSYIASSACCHVQHTCQYSYSDLTRVYRYEALSLGPTFNSNGRE